MTEKANLDQVCEALARTMKVLRDILDRPRNCAHKCNCMARNSSMISKELEFALIAGKSALILAADDAGTDSIAGDKCRKLATVIQDHINALSTPPAPDAVTAQAPSCETCGGSSRVMANHFDADRFDVSAPKCTDTIPCPDCQPKPSEGTVSEACRWPECECSSGAAERCSKPIYSDDARVAKIRDEDGRPRVVAICNELLTARATIERQAGEIDAMREAIGVAARKSIDRISQLEADLAAARLDAFDKAVADELPRVSHLEYDSHEICKHFAAKVRERIAAGDGK